jgi:hypothetical protein
VRKIVTAFVPFLCYLALFKNYNMLRAVTGLDEITKPSLTFLPWLENFVFHCMPHKIFASFHTPVLDVLAAVPYLIHFVLPFVFIAYLKVVRRTRDIYHFIWCLGWVNFTVVLFQFLFPTAPPWYTDSAQFGIDGRVRDDLLGPPEAGFVRVDRMLGFPLFNGIYSRSPLKFGAFPSLHVAWPCVVLCCGPWISRKVGIAHVAWITWAALYSNHHYAVDALMGIAIVLFITHMASRVWSPFVDRSVRQSLPFTLIPPPPSAFSTSSQTATSNSNTPTSTPPPQQQSMDPNFFTGDLASVCVLT